MKKILFIVAVVFLMPLTQVIAVSTESTIENTQTLCSDGEDNDGNGVSDLQDSNCSAFVPAPVVLENTQTLCSDGEDNDGNGVSDLQDSNCSAFVPAPVVPTTPTTPTTPVIIGPNGGSGGGSGWSGGSVSSGTPISASATSTNVDGIDMTCGNLFKTYMRAGKVNNKAEVMRLQAFLNKNLGIKLTVDGKYGSKTVAAVKKFQLKYKDSVLTPWGITLPTGYVYKTTQRQVNLLVCPARDIPMPVLN